MKHVILIAFLCLVGYLTAIGFWYIEVNVFAAGCVVIGWLVRGWIGGYHHPPVLIVRREPEDIFDAFDTMLQTVRSQHGQEKADEYRDALLAVLHGEKEEKKVEGMHIEYTDDFRSTANVEWQEDEEEERPKYVRPKTTLEHWRERKTAS